MWCWCVAYLWHRVSFRFFHFCFVALFAPSLSQHWIPSLHFYHVFRFDAMYCVLSKSKKTIKPFNTSLVDKYGGKKGSESWLYCEDEIVDMYYNRSKCNDMIMFRVQCSSCGIEQWQIETKPWLPDENLIEIKCVIIFTFFFFYFAHPTKCSVLILLFISFILLSTPKKLTQNRFFSVRSFFSSFLLRKFKTKIIIFCRCWIWIFWKDASRWRRKRSRMNTVNV